MANDASSGGPHRGPRIAEQRDEAHLTIPEGRPIAPGVAALPQLPGRHSQARLPTRRRPLSSGWPQQSRDVRTQHPARRAPGLRQVATSGCSRTELALGRRAPQEHATRPANGRAERHPWT